MKRYLHAWAMCRSMFCFIPSPWRIWDEDARPLMLVFLPILGLEIGALWWGLAWLLRHFSVPAILSALLLCAYPVAVTGAIHLDGFMDVVDAVRSCAAPDKRRTILKDPHVGSFAVIGCVFAVLALFCVFLLGSGDIRLLLLIPVVSRCGSSLSVTLLLPMTTSQYARQAIRKGHAATLLVMLAAALTAGFLISGTGGFALIIELAVYGLAVWRGNRALGGMNGDVAGYALTLSEICGAAAFALI